MIISALFLRDRKLTREQTIENVEEENANDSWVNS